jgi:hypothetical protein
MRTILITGPLKNGEAQNVAKQITRITSLVIVRLSLMKERGKFRIPLLHMLR